MRLCASFLIAVLSLFATSTTLAQTTAVVLGLRSVEGDDDVAHDVTQALRAAAGSKSRWTISERDVSMTQMALAHGCEEIDAACLVEIAKALQVARIVYGTVRRNSVSAEYDYDLTVSLFDAEQGSIVRTLNEPLPRAQASFRAMGERAERIIRQLASVGTDGVVVVSVNVPTATVQLDDEPVGETSDGMLRLEGVSAGDHRVEIRASGHAPHVAQVAVTEGSETRVQAELAALGSEAPPTAVSVRPLESGGNLEWLGWTLVGVGAASLVGVGVSVLIVTGVEDDALFLEYKDEIAMDNDRAGMQVVTDVCKEADLGVRHRLETSEVQEVADMCSTASTFEVLQWVFLGTAVVAGGVGTYILLSSGDEPSDGGTAARDPEFSLRPRFDGRNAGFTASLRF